MTDAVMTENVLERLRNGSTTGIVEVLDKEPSRFWKSAVSALTKKMRIDDYVVERIRILSQQGPVLYALKYPSLFDLNFLRLRFEKLGLPIPTFTLGMSSYVHGPVDRALRAARGGLRRITGREGVKPQQEVEIMKTLVEQGGAGVFSLVDEHAFRERYIDPELDPLRMALDLQGQTAGCVSIIPMFILYDRTRRWAIRPFWESFLGDPDRPGALRRLLHTTRAYYFPELLIGEPVYLLSQFEEFGAERAWESLPFELRNDLITSIDNRIRVNRGVEKLTKTQIKERVLQDESVKRAVLKEAAKEGASERKIRKKAEAYVEEIASDPYAQVHNVLYYTLRWMFALMFDKLDYKPEQFETLKQVGEKVRWWSFRVIRVIWIICWWGGWPL
jgi:hypothetical protein